MCTPLCTNNDLLPCDWVLFYYCEFNEILYKNSMDDQALGRLLVNSEIARILNYRKQAS